MGSTIIADIPVAFGGASIGESTTRLSLKIDRSKLDLIEAENLFCERRLTGKIQRGGADDGSGQLKFFDTDPRIDGSFDVHRFGVTSEAFTTGITFKTSEIDANIIAKFAKGTGRLVVLEAVEIPEDAEPDEHDEDDNGQQSIPGTYETDKPWREASLDALFSGALLKALKAAGIGTVGDLYDYQQPDPKTGYEKRLGDIKGIGPSKVQVIEDRMVEFWRDNPQEEAKVLARRD